MTQILKPTEAIEALLVEAYQRGWREGCETLIEDYPDALIAVPHKDAMGEGCGTFMGEIYPKIEEVGQWTRHSDPDELREGDLEARVGLLTEAIEATIFAMRQNGYPETAGILERALLGIGPDDPVISIGDATSDHG